MNIHTQTSIEIDFSRGQEITPVVVFDGVEQESQTFSNKTHQIEELLDYLNRLLNTLRLKTLLVKY